MSDFINYVGKGTIKIQKDVTVAVGLTDVMKIAVDSMSEEAPVQKSSVDSGVASESYDAQLTYFLGADEPITEATVKNGGGGISWDEDQSSAYVEKNKTKAIEAQDKLYKERQKALSAETAAERISKGKKEVSNANGIDGATSGTTPSIASQKKFIAGETVEFVDFTPVITEFGRSSLAGFIQGGGLVRRNNIDPVDVNIGIRADVRASITVSKDWSAGVDGIGDTIELTSKFLLQSVTESEAEKYQITETFGDAEIRGLGARPAIASFSGVVLDGEGAEWKQKFVELYKRRLRATVCIKANERVYVVYGNTVVEGYVLNLETNTSAHSPADAPFSFNMLVTGRTRVGGNE